MSTFPVTTGEPVLPSAVVPDFTPVFEFVHAHPAQANLVAGVFDVLSELETVSISALRVQHLRPPQGVLPSIWNTLLSDALELLERVGLICVVAATSTVCRGLNLGLARLDLLPTVQNIVRFNMIYRSAAVHVG